MEILGAFYNRSYENSINKKMLYYDYLFPEEEVMAYVRQLLVIPPKVFVEHDFHAETETAITPKDVFQFSSLAAGTRTICRILKDIGNPGVTFIQAGKILLDDGKTRSDYAYIKYGENHLKTAELIGLLFELTHTYFVSCIGSVFVNLGQEDQNKLLVRLFLRSKFIARLIKATKHGTVNVRQFLYMLSDTTYNRRKSNIKCILHCLKESKEYDFSGIIEKIHFL